MNAFTVTLTYTPITGTLSAEAPFILNEDWVALSICSTRERKCHLSQKSFLHILEHASTPYSKHLDGYTSLIPIAITIIVTEADDDIIREFQLTEPIHKPETAPATAPRYRRHRNRGKEFEFRTRPEPDSTE